MKVFLLRKVEDFDWAILKQILMEEQLEYLLDILRVQH
jgi:hypothetical protein